MSESKPINKNSPGEDWKRETVYLAQAAAPTKARGDKRFPSEPHVIQWELLQDPENIY